MDVSNKKIRMGLPTFPNMGESAHGWNPDLLNSASDQQFPSLKIPVKSGAQTERALPSKQVLFSFADLFLASAL
jgi:hypothetical protein